MKKNLNKKKVFGIIIALLLFMYYLVTWWFLHYAIGGKNKSAAKRKTVGKGKNTFDDDNADDNSADDKFDDIYQVCDESKVIEVNLFSIDNIRLYGRKMLQDKGHKWSIVVHGYRSDGDSMSEYAMEYYKNGYNVVIPDLRCHRNSGGKYLGMGWLDKDDIKLWIKHIINIDREAEIVLHGVSMGAATVMMLSGDELPDNVKVIVEDCGYTSVHNIFKSECKARFRITHYPALWLGSLICKIHVGYGWKEASALKQVANNYDIPMLFIHGDKDGFVPFSMLDELYESANCIKEKFVVTDAGHAKSMKTAGEAYWKKVFGFVNEYLS